MGFTLAFNETLLTHEVHKFGRRDQCSTSGYGFIMSGPSEVNKEAAEQWVQKGWDKLREEHDVVAARRMADRSKGLFPLAEADELLAAAEAKAIKMKAVERVHPPSPRTCILPSPSLAHPLPYAYPSLTRPHRTPSLTLPLPPSPPSPFPHPSLTPPTMPTLPSHPLAPQPTSYPHPSAAASPSS